MCFYILSFWLGSPPPTNTVADCSSDEIKYLHFLCLFRESLVKSSSHGLLQSSVCSITAGFTVTQDFGKFHCHGFSFRLRHLTSLGGPSGTCDYCLFCTPTYCLVLTDIPEYRITVVSYLSQQMSWVRPHCIYQCLPCKVLSSTASLSSASIVLFFFVPILHACSFMTPGQMSCNLDVTLENNVLCLLSMDSLWELVT